MGTSLCISTNVSEIKPNVQRSVETLRCTFGLISDTFVLMHKLVPILVLFVENCGEWIWWAHFNTRINHLNLRRNSEEIESAIGLVVNIGVESGQFESKCVQAVNDDQNDLV
jgi:hypothetical protein